MEALIEKCLEKGTEPLRAGAAGTMEDADSTAQYMLAGTSCPRTCDAMNMSSLP